ncbi:hypothetical protein HDV06_004319 [Boothiomyces sp. JEL0866]|nr:hypothetical protein HDV06_004319 [Boothiomyces sp. JEL0866]
MFRLAKNALKRYSTIKETMLEINGTSSKIKTNLKKLEPLINESKQELTSLNPDIYWQDNQKLAIQQQQLKSKILADLDKFENYNQQLKDFEELIGDSDEDMMTEILNDIKELDTKVYDYFLKQVLNEEGDFNDCFIEIRAGVGGVEACDWVQILTRMYERWGQQQGYESKVIDHVEGDIAGYKTATIQIKGEYAYGWAKNESGVHRFVRCSPFDAQNKRHTSFCNVSVSPAIDMEKTEIEIHPSELKIEVMRAQGAGGQHVNTTESAVRLTHLPTGITVFSQTEKSQHQNKKIGLELLKSKLYQMELRKKEMEKKNIYDSQEGIKWGNQIRNYVLHPYQMIKDTRSGYQRNDVENCLDGDIQEFMVQNLRGPIDTKPDSKAALEIYEAAARKCEFEISFFDLEMLKNLKRTHDLFGDSYNGETIVGRRLKITSKILDEYKDLGELPEHVERKFKKPASNALVVHKEKEESKEPLFNNSQQLIKIKESRKMPKPDWHPPWKLMRVISGHTGWVRCIDIDPSNEWFATGASDRMIKIWDMASGTLKLSLTGHISTVRGVAISDRHPYLFSCGEDKQIKCWDLEYNKVIRHYHGHLSGIYSLALHPTLDVLVTGGRDSTARVWDMRTKNQIFALTGHINTINAIQTNGVDPQIITASADSTIKLWDLTAGKAFTTLTHHKKGVRSLAMHPNVFSFTSGSTDNIKQWQLPNGDNGSMYFWDWKTGYNFQTNQAIAQPGSLENEAGIFASTFDKSGSRLLTCEADKTIKFDFSKNKKELPSDWGYNAQLDRYGKFKDDIVFACRPDRTLLFVANVDYVQEIIEKKNIFVKPVYLYNIINIYGNNVVTTEGQEWKRHRKISAPNFGEKNNIKVHSETVYVVESLINLWEKEGLDKINTTKVMFNIALHVFSGAALGVQLTWNDEAQIPAGHSYTFKQSLKNMLNNLYKYIAIPKFMYYFPIKSIQNVRKAIEEFSLYMKELLDDAKNRKGDGNLLNALAQSVETEEGTEKGFTEQEIYGNLFVFLFAGHETTAGTLNFAMAELARAPAVQQRIYQEVQTVCGDGPVEYHHLKQMPYVHAVMNEALRKYPPVLFIPKCVEQDQKLGPYTIPAGTIVDLHTHALHYNAKYWGDDALEFKPERWFADQNAAKDSTVVAEMVKKDLPLKSFFSYNKYAFIPFSEGIRSCLGKRFAEIEIVTVLSMLCQRFTFEFAKEQEISVSDLGVTIQSTEQFELKFTKRK